MDVDRLSTLGVVGAGDGHVAAPAPVSDTKCAADLLDQNNNVCGPTVSGIVIVIIKRSFLTQFRCYLSISCFIFLFTLYTSCNKLSKMLRCMRSKSR